VRIRRAFCEELGRSVSADEARREYLSLETRPKEFHFFCDSDVCFENGVEVVGVNYRVAAADTPKFKITHFREHPRQKHHPDCYYHTENKRVSNSLISEEGENRRRLSRKLVSDLVDVFDPRPKAGRKSGESSAHSPHPAITEENALRQDSPNDNNDKRTIRTSHLDRLVDTFLEAKNKLPYKEFSELSVHIVGVGKTTLAQYFRHINRATLDGAKQVYFGGAWLGKKRYGIGFKMFFIDKINDLPVSLYISKESLNDCKYKNYILEMLKSVPKQTYFRVFALGSFSVSPSGNGICLDIEDLRHLYLLPTLSKKSSAVEQADLT
jgi:hypothetical protein